LPTAEELMVYDIIPQWAMAEHRPVSAEAVAVSMEVAASRQYLQGGGPGGFLRVFYTLNPLLPCRVPSMAGAWIVSLADLMRFLERTAPDVTGHILDTDLATFIAARADRRTEMQVNAMLAKADGMSLQLGELVLLKDLQPRYHSQPMPRLAKWMVARLQPALEQWHNRPRRAALAARLEALAQEGYLARLLAAVDDTRGRAADRAGAGEAAMEQAAINAELAAIGVSDPVRLTDAESLGHAVIGAIGLMALIMAALWVLIG
jgi:hypothetical protein